jgi:hypothetical protein
VEDLPFQDVFTDGGALHPFSSEMPQVPQLLLIQLQVVDSLIVKKRRKEAREQH